MVAAQVVAARESCRPPARCLVGEPAPVFEEVHPSGICPSRAHLLNQEDANKYLIRAVQNAMVTVGELPPEFPTDGQLWWSTWCLKDEMTLYIYVQDFTLTTLDNFGLDRCLTGR